ncbi:hypothetical protein BD779DRAFT_1514187 [Infundibulicybe gibba]|nr:hypothetical protein BD779DRAFT_1514187 [Infundibulicybe gibba]
MFSSSKPLGRVLETRYYFLCLLTYVLSAAALVNVTFDDTFPNPRGGPSIIYGGGWFNSANCSGCIPGLDENRMSGKTWHAHFFDSVGAPPASAPVSSNHTGSAAVPFKGTAIYVFCALPRAQAIDISFSLDGLTVGNFTRAPTNSSGFDYNVLVYANTTARPGAHQLIIENGINSNRSALVFDSAIYTHGSSPKHPRLTTAAIVGVVISVMVVLALLILGVLLYHRRKIRQDPIS